MKKKTPFRRTQLVPAVIAGVPLMIAANLIPKEHRKVHHGVTAAGAQVNSPESITVGDTTIVWANKGAPAVAFKSDDLEVLGTQILATRGLMVQPATPA